MLGQLLVLFAIWISLLSIATCLLWCSYIPKILALSAIYFDLNIYENQMHCVINFYTVHLDNIFLTEAFLVQGCFTGMMFCKICASWHMLTASIIA